MLMSRSALLVTEQQRANTDILLTMLGELDKEIISEYYGLFGRKVLTASQLGAKYRVEADVIREIVAKDLRKIAITPEWQMMLVSFSQTVRAQIERHLSHST